MKQPHGKKPMVSRSPKKKQKRSPSKHLETSVVVSPSKRVTERIILDSSVIIAAAIKPHGSTYAFLGELERSDIAIIWSQKLGYEIHEKFYSTPSIASAASIQVREALIEWLEWRGTLVEDVKLDNPLPLAQDRDDDYLVALARRYRAVLVTLDQKLIDNMPSDVMALRPAGLTASRPSDP